MTDMVPMYGFGGGGGAGATLTITVPVGATVTVSKDGKVKPSKVATTGTVVFKGLETGTWTITITNGTDTATKPVEIKADYSATISFNTIPEFTYTGDFEIVNDSDVPITISPDNWKIRFLTSGTLTFTSFNSWDGKLDVFLVGGGAGGTYANDGPGGGGGSGYTATHHGIPVNVGTSYDISIGAGGPGGTNTTHNANGSAGGDTSAFGHTAAGGTPGNYNSGNGGDGGSGGCVYGVKAATGGSDGGNAPNSSSYTGGKGQREKPGPNGETGNTREFGRADGKLYCNGGRRSDDDGAPNTGDGAASASSKKSGRQGGSGIVIIRNAREVA